MAKAGSGVTKKDYKATENVITTEATSSRLAGEAPPIGASEAWRVSPWKFIRAHLLMITYSHTSPRFFVLTATAIVLALSPLSPDTCLNTFNTRLACNALGWSVPAVLGILIFSSKNLLNTFFVRTILVATLLLLAIGLGINSRPADVQTMIRYISAIWIVPIIVHLLSHKHRLVFSLTLLGILSLHAQWGIAHMIFQHDLGMHIIGESRISPSVPAVAKFSIGQQKIIRAYGPHSHPNDFAGTLMIGLVLMTITDYRRARAYPTRLFVLCITAVLVLGILVSFSRTTFAVLALWFLYVTFNSKHAYLTQSLKRPYVQRMLLVIALLCGTLVPLIWFRSIDTESRALVERVSGITWSVDIIRNQGIFHGAGIGQYTHTLQKYLTSHAIQYQPWEITPVHSVPLLLLAEIGLIPSLLVLVAAVYFILKTRAWSIAIIVVPLLLTDHYILTQISPLLWLATLLAFTWHNYKNFQLPISNS